MTLIAHSPLPAFERLRQEGQEVLSLENARKQDIRELHIGIYNMMPDAVLEATERQFLRLIGSSNRIVQFYVHLFSPRSIERKGKSKAHIEQYYESFEDYQNKGLDAMIVTGANPVEANLTDEVFWDEFCEMIDWAKESVTSVMCSCFATHAVFKVLFDENRILLPKKCWGVYSHTLTDKTHPLVSNTNTKFDVPHSHIYSITEQQAKKNGVFVLATSDVAGLHLAVTKDFRFVFTQGHSEYDSFSLLKEYKREVMQYKNGVNLNHPLKPDNYFSDAALAILKDEISPFPEQQLTELLHNTWVDTGKSIFNNWLGLVYKMTDKDQKIRLMKHLDPENPLNC